VARWRNGVRINGASAAPRREHRRVREVRVREADAEHGVLRLADRVQARMMGMYDATLHRVGQCGA
jgi:hypothetical protein